MKRDLKASDLSSISWMDRLVAAEAVTEDLVPFGTPEDPEGPATSRRDGETNEDDSPEKCRKIKAFVVWLPDLVSSPLSCELRPGSSASVSPVRWKMSQFWFGSEFGFVSECSSTSGE